MANIEKRQWERDRERIKALSAKSLSFILELEPKTVPSQLDERVLVSEFMWAVTLITYNGDSNNHAQICFEGIEKGKYFCQVGDFTGRKVELNSYDQVKFTTRSEIWMRPSEKVQDVMALIQKQASSGVAPSFSLFGKKSVVRLNDEFRGGEPNCFDWARDMLQLLEIEFEQNPVKKAIKDKAEYLLAAAKYYTRAPDYYLDIPVNVSI